MATGHILPPPSAEQKIIVDDICAGANVATFAVAGAGKTTTILNAAVAFRGRGLDGVPDRNHVVSITYNAKLKTETRNKAANLGIYIEVHSFHSFCVAHYDRKCYTDTQMRAILNAKTPPLRPFSIDMLFVDEGQDMNPLFHELICKICADSSTGPPQLCVLGDKRQCINQFLGADERFLTHVAQTLDVNGRPWRFPKISESFRVTRPMAEFVNTCMLNDLPGKGTIQSGKTHIVLPANRERHNTASSSSSPSNANSTTRSGTTYAVAPTMTPAPKPRYLICNAFGDDLFVEFSRYLDMGYAPWEITVVAASVRKEVSPIRQLENRIKRDRPDIQVYIPTADDEKLDTDVIRGKMVFSTFTQTKGLEWPVVIVIGADNGYFEMFAKDLSPVYCPNQLYVVATRALECITLVHHNANDYLPFLNVAKLPRYCDVVTKKRVVVKTRSYTGEKKMAVTDLVRFIPQQVLDECRSLLTLSTARLPGVRIDIDSKSTQPGGSENVSEITGTAIPAYFDFHRNGNQMSILEELKREQFEKSLVSGGSDPGLLNELSRGPVTCDFSDEEGEEESPKTKPKASKKKSPSPPKKKTPEPVMGHGEKPFNLNDIVLATITIAQLLYIANCWCAHMSGLHFKVLQIKVYAWLTNDQLNACVDRLESLPISSAGMFEKKIAVSGRPELMGRVLSGAIDCIDGADTYEFKCTSALSTEHVIQLAIYMYMRNIELQKKSSADAMGLIFSRYIQPVAVLAQPPINPGKLYNVLTDEMITIENDMDAFTEVVRLLMNQKFGPKKKLTDEAFVDVHAKVVDRYRKAK